METDDPLPDLVCLGQDVYFHPVTISAVISILFIGVLLIISALISASEVAYFSLNAESRQMLGKKKDKKSVFILQILENTEKLSATILVASSFVNLGIIIIAAYVIHKLVYFSNSPVLGFILQVAVITLLMLLFGEILPKIYASRNSMRIIRIMAIPLRFMERLFRPLNSMLIYSSSFLNKRIRNLSSDISVVELSHALDITTDDEIYEDKEILEGIVKFGNKNAVEIMRARVDVVALELKDSFEKVINQINESGYSRVPVYSESFDNVQGIIYTKDMLPYIHKTGTFNWQTLIRPPFFVPETKKIDDLLEEFQKNKVHMAIVVDEYGGSSGIVTLEDVLEEIVGDILDEFDEDENYSTKISDKEYLFDGKILLNDFYKITGTESGIFDEAKGDADTLAGLILELKKEIPALHEKIIFKNFIFTIDSVDNRRIKKIRAEIN